ncbi:unnamed protein product [Merluccius merluccius]
MELLLLHGGTSSSTAGRMTGKPCERTVKWQLCYDTSARTWWMQIAADFMLWGATSTFNLQCPAVGPSCGRSVERKSGA